MSGSMQQVDEERILSSLYGMTLAGLAEMHKKRSNEPIRHLIARAIEVKEELSNEEKGGKAKKRLPRLPR